MKLKGTKTEENLMYAFSGESRARNKYTYYASKARAEGFEQIAEIFETTANNEKEHAKMWFKHLYGGAVPSTIENLKDAAEGEHDEWTSMYKGFAEVAKKEGFDDIAKEFEGVADIEKIHEERFLKLLENVKTKTAFVKKEAVIWECRNCGHRHIGTSAPLVCPVCKHPQSFFEVEAKNY